jgi:hypothetical protein
MGRHLIFYVLASLSLASCKSLYDLKSYSKSSARGAISGNDWVYGYGYTDPEAKLPNGMKHMIVLMTAKPKNACPDVNDQVPDAREVAITIDGKVGEMKLGGNSGNYETEEDLFTYKKQERKAIVALHDPSQPPEKQYAFATSGKVKIIKITADYIQGAVVGKIDPDHFVNGQFKVKICKYGQLN